MGGGGSSSQQSAVSDSISRQAIFTPSSESISKSIDQLLGIYQQSTAQLAPFTETAFDAMNDMRFWQGMAGIDPALKQQNQLQALMQTLNAPGAFNQKVIAPDMWNSYTPQPQSLFGVRGPGAAGHLMNDFWQGGDLYTPPTIFSVGHGGEKAAFENQKTLMNVLESVNQNLSFLSNTNDPEKRQQYYSAAMEGFSSFDTEADRMLEKFYADSTAMNAPAQLFSLDGRTPAMSKHFAYNDPLTGQLMYVDKDQIREAQKTVKELGGAYPEDPIKSKGAGEDPTGASSKEFLKDVTSIRNLRDQVMAKFRPEGLPAPGKEQMMARLEQTPGYQTQLESGLQAIQNTQVAKGLFGSGRAAKEITRYGQDYAQNALDKIIARDATMAGLTMPIVQQQSSNTVAQAAPIMASTQLAGSNWNMSPWTSKSHSESQGTSETHEGMGGLGGILGSIIGGIF